ncbi:tetratricopeptide repeat protein [Novosphingobium mathurense]
MTQPTTTIFRPQRIALVIAGLVAAGAVGTAILRDDEVNTASGNAAMAASASLPASASIDDLEQATRDSPKDSAAWQRLGLAYFEAARFAEAANAYGKATELAPGIAVLWSALGEARVMASDRDPMPPQAVSAFEKAIAIDPKDPRSRYFMAVKRDLSGDHQGAVNDWLALLEDSPADAPWRSDLIRTIEQVGKIHKIDVADKLAAADRKAASSAPMDASLPVAARGIPGPTAQDLANASRLAPSEQRNMADGMVASLEQRLANDPSYIDGWVMLMRSRRMLEQPEKAQKALADAIAANPGKADYLRQQAGMLGIREK